MPRSFSQRGGYSLAPRSIQTDSLDTQTRTAIWNVSYDIWEDLRNIDEMNFASMVEDQIDQVLWRDFFHQPVDEWGTENGRESVKVRILDADWFRVMDVVEYLAEILERGLLGESGPILAARYRTAINGVFEEFLVGYRFVGTEIVPIVDDVQVAAVQLALDDVAPLPGARRHLDRALQLLGERENVDYPGIVRESITAVESVCKHVAGEKKKTLSEALKQFEKRGVKMHGALKTALDKLYGWTSDEAGVRHAGIEDHQVNREIATFMLVTCSAFVSYILESNRGLNEVESDG